jgi:anion-transporting  ArsA/GET3 family ATPase
VGFVLVASPTPISIDEALAFHERLHAESMPIAGVVANRLTPSLWPDSAPLPSAAELDGPLAATGAQDDGFARRLATTLAEHEALARAERQAADRLFASVAAPAATVPRLDSDVHDLAGLARMAEWL